MVTISLTATRVSSRRLNPAAGTPDGSVTAEDWVNTADGVAAVGARAHYNHCWSACRDFILVGFTLPRLCREIFRRPRGLQEPRASATPGHSPPGRGAPRQRALGRPAWLPRNS